MREPGSLPEAAPPGPFHVTPDLASHPTAATLGRLADYVVPIEVRLGPIETPAWLRGEDLVEPGPAAERALLDCRARYFGADIGFAGLALVLDVVTAASVPLVAVLTERRAIDLPATHVAMRLGDEPGMAVREPRLAVLPGDPASGHAGVRTVADVETLFDCVAKTFFHGFVAGLVNTVAGLARGSRRTLWAMATSSTATTLSLASSVIADPRAVSEEIGALFRRVGGVVAATAPTFQEVTCWNHREFTQVRRTCCLFHKLPDATYCSTCPFRSPETRTALARRAISARLGVPAP